ncbi:MAG: hypothetical protein K2M70_12465 [Lachnospiraceae bacterium]|nr:hypothetical protein [Lachnospiraceae bacterium]
MYEIENIVVLDVGRYGFVKLQYYKPPQGFEDTITFTDSVALFENLRGFSSLPVKILVLNIKEKMNITGMIAFATRNVKFYFQYKSAVFLILVVLTTICLHAAYAFLFVTCA